MQKRRVHSTVKDLNCKAHLSVCITRITPLDVIADELILTTVSAFSLHDESLKAYLAPTGLVSEPRGDLTTCRGVEGPLGLSGCAASACLASRGVSQGAGRAGWSLVQEILNSEN